MTRRRNPLRSLRSALLALTLLAACRTGSIESDIQRAALRTLFLEREHDGELVLWSDGAQRGPVLETLGEPLVSPLSPALDSALGVPVARVTQHTVDSLFRAHPDGWAAFFRAHPQAGGIVEVATPRYAGDRQTATVVVGRSCGEHCRQAWRVSVRVDGARSRAIGVVFLRVQQT